MGVLIDTTVCVAIERGIRTGQTAPGWGGDQPVFLAAITASELLHGVHRADTALRRRRRERFVEVLLSEIPVLAFDLDVARIHAVLWADLKRDGRMIGAHDLQIAATALAHDLKLLTENLREFKRIDGLEVVLYP